MANHSIVYFEIPAQDVGRTGQFYGDVFGWRQEPSEAFPYVQLHPQDGPGGGVTATGEGGDGAPAYPIGEVLMYISTDSIEESLAAIQAHGGTVDTGKTAIPGMGWFALFRDPAGNRLGLFSEG